MSVAASKSASKPPAATEPTSKRELTARERVQLRAMTMCDERTIKRWWAGVRGNSHIDKALAIAAKKLGIKP